MGKRRGTKRRKETRSELKRSRKLAELKRQTQISEELSKGEDWKVRMCTRKTAYESETRAIAAAIRASERYGKPSRCYLCPICSKWHLSTARRAID